MSIWDDIYQAILGIPKAVQDLAASLAPGADEFRRLAEAHEARLGRTPFDTTTQIADLVQVMITTEYSRMYMASLGLVAFIRRQRVGLARDFALLKSKIETIDFEEFKEAWKVARQLVPLQGRLVMEQAFWDLGDPWKSLYTGFKAIGDDSMKKGDKSAVVGTSNAILTSSSGSPSLGPTPPGSPKWVKE